MPRNFARYEQFLRIHALYDTLASVRQPLDDATLIARVKERLGLVNLSPRTLHRDCEFLTSCGYHLERSRLPAPPRNGWELHAEPDGRPFPGERPTLLEMVAFAVARDLLAPFAGTVLWSGIESLRAKLEHGASQEQLDRVAAARRVFHVPSADEARLADHPRMLSALGSAIAEHREIDVTLQSAAGAVQHRLHPAMFLIRLPSVALVAWDAGQPLADRPLAIDLASIQRVTKLDTTFTPRPVDPDTIGGLHPAGP